MEPKHEPDTATGYKLRLSVVRSGHYEASLDPALPKPIRRIASVADRLTAQGTAYVELVSPTAAPVVYTFENTARGMFSKLSGLTGLGILSAAFTVAGYTSAAVIPVIALVTGPGRVVREDRPVASHVTREFPLTEPQFRNIQAELYRASEEGGFRLHLSHVYNAATFAASLARRHDVQVPSHLLLTPRTLGDALEKQPGPVANPN